MIFWFNYEKNNLKDIANYLQLDFMGRDFIGGNFLGDKLLGGNFHKGELS